MADAFKNLQRTLFMPLLLIWIAPRILAQQPTPEPGKTRTNFLQRFFSHNPKPRPVTENATKSAQEKWLLFPPGLLPTGKVLNEMDAGKLEAGNYTAHNFYLIGSFVVRATGDHIAVLRFTDATAPIRIIAAYHHSSMPPPEGTKVTLDETRPFQIMSVARNHDGSTLNFYVRDITNK